MFARREPHQNLVLFPVPTYIPISDDDEYHGRAHHSLRSVYTPAWKVFFRNGMKLYIKRELLHYGLPSFEEMMAPWLRYLQSLMASVATSAILH